jgi:hypothetical protein
VLLRWFLRCFASGRRIAGRLTYAASNITFVRIAGAVLFMASPPLGETVLLFPEAELEPVALPSPSLEGSCCAIAPASGNAHKLAASSIEREIETIATSLSELAACTYAATFIKRGGPPTGCLFRNAAHAESSWVRSNVWRQQRARRGRMGESGPRA